MISIRLARGGAKKRPFYHIVVSDVRKPRDGGYIERIGYYNQRACGQEVRLHLEHERADYWLSQGAKPTTTVATLLKQAAKNRPATPAAVEEAPAAEVKITEAAPTA